MFCLHATVAAVTLAISCGGVAGQVAGHWKFDEPGGATAQDSVGSNHGTLLGGARFVPGAGVSGGAIALARASAGVVSMGDVFAMTGGVDFSVSLWLRLAPGDETYGKVVSCHDWYSYNGYFVGVNQDPQYGYGAAERVWFYNSSPPQTEPQSTTAVNDGAWHHVVCAYEASGQTRVFVDGAPAESSRPSCTILANGAPFMVGGSRRGGTLINEFEGMVDDLQVYSEALTDNAVQYLLDHPGEVLPTCYADCDRSTGWYVLDIFDFLCFQLEWYRRAPYACGCDTSTGPGVCDVFDFLCFQNAYAAGCP